MNYQRAIEILGLEPNFPDEELKKRYRSLARQYHPDNFINKPKKDQEDAEAKMKDINEAYDYLEKVKLDSGSYHTEFDPSFLNGYRQRIQDSLQSFIKNSYEEGVEYPTYYKHCYNRVQSIVNMYFGILAKASKLKIMDDILERASSQIKTEYEIFRNEFLLGEGIPLKDDKKNYNYKCSVAEFYSQLQSIKKDKSTAVEKRIKTEAAEYELWASYPFLKEEIDWLVNNALKEANENTDVDLSSLLAQMHKQIKDLFDKHIRLLNRMDSFRNYFIEKYNSDAVVTIENNFDKVPHDELSVKTGIELEEIEMIISLINCHTSYTSILAYNGTVSMLEGLENEHATYRENKKINNNQAVLKKIFNIVNAKLNEALQKYGEDETEKVPYNALEIMGCFLELYELMRRNELDADDGLILKQLTFEDTMADYKILDDLITRINIRNSLRVFIMLGEKVNLGSKTFIMREEDETYINLIYFVGSEKRRMRLPRQMLQNEYIPLEEFLANGTFIGKREIETNALVLYAWYNFVVRLTENGEFIIDTTPIGESRYDFATVPYKDKEFTKRMILKEVYNKFLAFNETIDPSEPESGFGRVRSYFNKFNWFKNLIK